MVALLWMSVTRFLYTDAWRVSPSYQEKLDKDLNGLITTMPIIKMPDLPNATSASAPNFLC
jgi:hypothetical protein